jgi:protocatechuate 3,4-dioxygenase beta subunit
MRGVISDRGLPRRTVLVSAVAVAVWGPVRAFAQTSSCTPGTLTPRLTEGPYFKPESPERSVLIEPGIPGAQAVLTGLVLDSACRPVKGALVDLWHADGLGRYDNSGYRLRGHQYTDAFGRYRFETVMPAPYVGRTRHFHVKVQAPASPVLTTQLYFPGEAGNARDGLFRKELLLTLQRDGSASTGSFDFVVVTA